MAISTATLNSWITAAETSLAAWQAAEAALAAGAQSYTIDTGQTRQTVTRSNTTEVRNMIESLMNRISMLCKRRDGGAVQVGPSW